MQTAAQVNFFKPILQMQCHAKLIDISKPLVMGILNLSPDSFYEKSRTNKAQLLEKARQMLAAGASILDIGGYSTRPQATAVSEAEECERIQEAIEILAENFPEALISIDTFRAKVAKIAIKAGACMVNDISGGQFDSEMHCYIAEAKVPYILGHLHGNVGSMHQAHQYSHVAMDIALYFSEKIAHLKALGVADIIIDPGFGFSKSINQNFELLNKLEIFSCFDNALMIGISRKSMIYKSLNITPEEALNGTSVLHSIALSKGARILRVHDVKEAMQTINLFNLCQVNDK